MGLMHCPDCGKQHSDAAPLCPQCGRAHEADTDVEKPQSIALPETKLSGTVIGNKYRLDKMVGRGGMACVYQGTHLQLDQQVAIKIVYRHLAIEPEIQRRFRTEAQIQFTMQHPGVVRVIDLIDEPDFLGMTMDWIEGDTLHKWLRKRTEPPTPDDILRLYRPLLEAVGYAHSRSVIHRDIKPGNILLQGAPGKEVTKITDFGIAKILDDHNTFQTQGNASIGTPTYMSPEQVEGRKEIDHRVDIYSLGVLLFCLATGRPPFKGATAIETAAAHLSSQIPPLQKMYQFADLRLEPIIHKAMGKAPEDRYHSCEAFLEALQDALSTPSAADFQTVINISLDDIRKPEQELSASQTSDVLGDTPSNREQAQRWYADSYDGQPLPQEDLSTDDINMSLSMDMDMNRKIDRDIGTDIDVDTDDTSKPTDPTDPNEPNEPNEPNAPSEAKQPKQPNEHTKPDEPAEDLLDSTTEQAIVELPLIVGREVAVAGGPKGQQVGESLPQEEEFALTIESDPNDMLGQMLQARIQARIEGKEKAKSPANTKTAKDSPPTIIKSPPPAHNPFIIPVMLLLIVAGLGVIIWYLWPW